MVGIGREAPRRMSCFRLGGARYSLGMSRSTSDSGEPFDPLDRRPLLRRIHRAGWVLFTCALGLVAVYLLIAWWYSTLTPTVRVSGEEGWRRALGRDAGLETSAESSPQPTYPKYIDLLWVDRPECVPCDQSWLDAAVVLPDELRLSAAEGSGRGAGILKAVWEPDALVFEGLNAKWPEDWGWQLGAWMLEESAPMMARLRELAPQAPFGLRPVRRFDERTARFFGLQHGWEAGSSDEAGAAAQPKDAATDDAPMESFDECSPRLFIDLANLFLLDARHAAHRGEGARAVDSLKACMEFADRAGEGATPIAQIAAITLRAWTWREVCHVLRMNPAAFDDVQLARLDTVVGWVGDGPIGFDLRTTRAVLDDQLQRSFSDDGAGEGLLLASPAMQAFYGPNGIDLSSAPARTRMFAFIAGPVLALVAPSRAEYKTRLDTELDTLEAEVSLELWKRPPEPTTPSYREDAAGALALERVAPTRSAARRIESYAENREAARVALASERFRRTEGRAPQSLEELVPKYLREIPRDVKTGKPLTRLDGLPDDADTPRPRGR